MQENIDNIRKVSSQCLSLGFDLSLKERPISKKGKSHSQLVKCQIGTPVLGPSLRGVPSFQGI